MPAPDWKEEEEIAALLVGKIVRNWSVLNEAVLAGIASCHGIAQARALRFPRAAYVHEPYAPPARWLTYPEIDDKWRVRWSYFRRLCRHLHDDKDARAALDRLIVPVAAAYAVRNDVAHYQYRLIPWERSMLFMSQRWRDAARLEARKPAGERKPVVTEKRYTFDELGAYVVAIDQHCWAIREIGAAIPIVGEDRQLPKAPD